MPGRNTVKEYVTESYYHIYNRGVNKNEIFLDDQDRNVFLGLLKRYLGSEVEKKPNRTNHPNYSSKLELLAFCLMNNHFHLFLYQNDDASAIASLMKSVGVAYGMYFNERYRRVGPIFQQRYSAVRIMGDAHYEHISRYIHMNPKQYKTYEWSSLPYYVGQRSADWVRPERIISTFPSAQSYLEFLDEYAEKREEIEAYKSELANS